MKINTEAKTGLRCGVATAAILLFFLAGCKSGEEKEAKPEVSVQAATAQKADISRIVNADAIIFPVAQSVITPKVSAPVSKFFVVRGQPVHKGQLLAELENRDLAAAAMDNKGTYEQAEATYQISKGATLPEDAKKAELDLLTAQQSLDAQQKLYDSREMLFKQGALPRKDLDQARVALVQAKSQYDTAKQHLEHLNALVRVQSLKAAGGQLTSAHGKFLGAEAMLSYTQIHSPIDGVVTDRPLYPGEMASATAPLLTVMDVSSVIAKAHIPQSDALLLRSGDKATIDVPGLQSVAGTVSLVSPALDPSSTTVEVWIQAKNPKQLLRPGTTARISITAQTVHDALVVPAIALLNASAGSAQVMVIDSQSTAQSRDVKLGIQTPEQAQIVDGLKPGEQVVTQGAYGLPDKTKVKIEKPGAAGGEGNADAAKDEKGSKD
ncbi:MAG TPA: efflux RND transporter periplasmic adaptor subunit [Candidatus Angelobacter sp.]|nr:efflux RND transporter periplasmic adaptor subunit [Candidatus Angelobacter sp.]